MAKFKLLAAANRSSIRSNLNQLVDILQNDISGSTTRKKFLTFVTGGVGPGVTSSMYQTVFDQNYTLQTANEILDFTIGLYESGSTVQDAKTGDDNNGKILFASNSLMMREKVDLYKQYAKILLGSSTASFFAPGYDAYDATNTITARSTGSYSGGTYTAGDQIEEALFVNFKRLFARDSLKQETFALRLNSTGVFDGSARDATTNAALVQAYTGSNLNLTSPSGSVIFTDIGSSTNRADLFGGNVGLLANSSNTDEKVGLVWYDQGVAVLDMGKVFYANQHVSGVIDAMRAGTYLDAAAGQTIIGAAASGNANASFIPDLMVSASVDNVVDTVAATRFQSGSLTAMTFQNNTGINSTLYYCRAGSDEFNYSSNPTYLKSDGTVRVLEETVAGEGARAFSFITSIGLYDANQNLLAVAKLSRPVEKNDEKDITFRIRLDF